MTATLRVMNLTKQFGDVTAVDNISFSATQGEVVGFLGPNGAGKSTSMKMITGFLTPTAGTSYICGYDIAEQPIEAKKMFGYLPEGAPSYPDMTVKQFISFIADIRGIAKKDRELKINEVINKVNLQSVLKQKIDTLSKGFKRRVGLAQALIHDPSVLILDEPTDGLDPNQKREVRKLISNMARDKVIILSTHILEEVEAVCDRVIVVAAGKIILDSTPTELVAKVPQKTTIAALEEVFVNITAEYQGVS
jgi:ABC-2 type transport system ATP-binding protein